MRDSLSLGERLTDLRVSKGITQEELAEQLGISRTAISNYENIDNCNKKTIDHLTLVKLAKYYGVSANYLLGFTENLKETAYSDLHLSDDAIAVLKSQKFNNRLISEILTHPEFAEFIDDIEIFVQGYVQYRFNKLNAEVQIKRIQLEASRQFYNDVQQTDRDLYEKATAKGLIEESDFFAYKTQEILKRMLKDLREKHKHEGENLTFTKEEIYRDLSPEELQERFIDYNAYIKGITPEELVESGYFPNLTDFEDIDMQLVLDWLGLRNDSLTREEYDYLYDHILMKSNKLYKFSHQHKNTKKKRKDTKADKSDQE